jgi:hypothetical protein
MVVEQKCHMIDVAFLKAGPSIVIYCNMTSVHNLIAITQKAAKENVQAVTRKLEFPEERQLKVLLGGLLLVNSVYDVLALTGRIIIAAFELFRKRRRRHNHANESLASLLTE